MERQAPPPGTMLAGKYRVDRTIGAGGMGVVVEATHVALAQKVAVKLLPRDPEHPEDTGGRLLREARIAAQLPGEHVARALDFGDTDDGGAFLVMELLVGRDLESELEARGRLPAGEAVALVLQACEGVAEAHAVGLVHRDLKPANLFLTTRRDGSPLVKVLDFGIATWVLGRNEAGGSSRAVGFGTPAYMAPEQFTLGAEVDARCDQYALAVVLYELVTGAPPFAAQSLGRLALLVAKAPPPPLSERAPDAPRELWPVLARALAKHPDERYPDLSAFAAALSPFGGPSAERSRRGVATVLGAPAPEAFEAPPAREPPAAVRRLGVEPGAEAGAGDTEPASFAVLHDALRSRAAGARAWSRRARRIAIAAGICATLGGCAALGLSLDATPTVAAADRGLARRAEDAVASAARASIAEPVRAADDAVEASGAVRDPSYRAPDARGIRAKHQPKRDPSRAEPIERDTDERAAAPPAAIEPSHERGGASADQGSARASEEASAPPRDEDGAAASSSPIPIDPRAHALDGAIAGPAFAAPPARPAAPRGSLRRQDGSDIARAREVFGARR